MPANVQEQYDKIYKYCYFKVKNKEIAEDLTQETFLKYFSQTSYISHGKPLAYLYTIARNQCIDYFRKHKEETLKEKIELEDAANMVVTKVALTQAVRDLPPELSELVILRFGSELRINEIAEVLEISRFSVHRKINAALKELKKVIREEDFYE